MESKDVKVLEMPVPAAEPAPLGLIGLAVAALVLGAHDVGWVSGGKALMIPWTIFLGATAQLIAGIMDFKRNNVFGGTAFTTYSLLWYSVSLTLVIVYQWDKEVYTMDHYAWGLIGFLFFSIILTGASLFTNKVFFAILVAIDLAIISLVPHVLFATPSEPVGLSLLGVSALSFYGAGAVLINTMLGGEILPMGSALLKPPSSFGEKEPEQ